MRTRKIFQALTDQKVTYVVPRKHQAVFESPREDDIDIIVHKNDFSLSVNVLRSEGHEFVEGYNTEWLHNIYRAMINPKKALNVLINSPKEAIVHLSGSKVQSNSLHMNRKLRMGNTILDIRDGLAYKSPMNNRRIPVDPSVTNGMLDRRKQKGPIFVPSPPDELAHIIPHCVFDKDGNFSKYYKNRCNTLCEIVRDDQEYESTFVDLLDTIFFGASDLVYSLIKSGEYNSIRAELRSFSNY